MLLCQSSLPRQQQRSPSVAMETEENGFYEEVQVWWLLWLPLSCWLPVALVTNHVYISAKHPREIANWFISKVGI